MINNQPLDLLNCLIILFLKLTKTFGDSIFVSMSARLNFVSTWCAFIIFLLKINVYEPMDLQHIDKLHHSLAYFTLATCWLFALQKKQSKYVIVLCCIFFGIVLEILQYAITNYRTGDYLDVLANSFGVILGVFVFNKVSKKNRLKNEKTSN